MNNLITYELADQVTQHVSSQLQFSVPLVGYINTGSTWYWARAKFHFIENVELLLKARQTPIFVRFVNAVKDAFNLNLLSFEKFAPFTLLQVDTWNIYILLPNHETWRCRTIIKVTSNIDFWALCTCGFWNDAFYPNFHPLEKIRKF